MERDFRYFRERYTDPGARQKFEDTCAKLLYKKYGYRAAHIRPNPGDDGADILVHSSKSPDLFDNYQCKYIDRIGKSQKNQIQNSFNGAIESKKYRMSCWILCVSCRLSIDEQKWWVDWRNEQENQSGIKIILFDEGYLISELKKYGLYDEIFDIELPGTLSRIGKDVKSIKADTNKIVSKAGCNTRIGVITLVIGVIILVLVLFVLLLDPASKKSVTDDIIPQTSETAYIAIPGPVAGDGSNPLFGAWELVDQIDNGERAPEFAKLFTVCSDGFAFVGFTANPELETSQNHAPTVINHVIGGDGLSYPASVLINLIQSLATNRSPKLFWSENGIDFREPFLRSDNPGRYYYDASCSFARDYDGSLPVSDSASVPTPISVGPEDIDRNNLDQTFLLQNKYLIIHVSGYYWEPQKANQQIDTYLVYKRAERMLGLYLNFSLIGTWTDCNQKSWRFEADPAKNKMSISFGTKEGEAYSDVELRYCDKDTSINSDYEQLVFTYIDPSSQQRYTQSFDVVYYDGNLLYLLDVENNKKEFWLTRD